MTNKKKPNLLLSSEKKSSQIQDRLEASAKAEKNIALKKEKDVTFVRVGQCKIFDEDRLDSMKSQLKKKLTKKAAAGTTVIVAYLLNQLLDDYEKDGVDALLDGKLSGLDDFVANNDKRYS